jgi:hypothetical protein
MNLKEHFEKVASYRREVRVFWGRRDYPLADFYEREDEKTLTLLPVEGADIHNLVESALSYARDYPDMTVRVGHNGALRDIDKDKSLDDNVTAVAGHPVRRAEWRPAPTMDMTVAADDGDIARVRELVAMGNDVNALNAENGWPPLSRAAYHGHLDIVEYLLSQKADIKRQEANGFTALHLAALGGQKKVVEFLLEQGADVSIRARGKDANLARECSETNRHHDITALIDSWPDVLEKRRLAEIERQEAEFAAHILRNTELQDNIQPSRVIRFKL